MFDGIRDRSDRANVHSSQRESIEVQHANDGGEIPNPSFKPQVRDVAVRRTHPAVVVTNHPPSELSQSVGELPDGGESMSAIVTYRRMTWKSLLPYVAVQHADDSRGEAGDH